MGDKRTNEPVRLTETCALPIVDHHISIARSIPFLVEKLGDPARFSLGAPLTPMAQAHWRLHWHSCSDMTASIPPIPPLNLSRL
jgi:hypothetical protein